MSHALVPAGAIPAEKGHGPMAASTAAKSEAKCVALSRGAVPEPLEVSRSIPFITSWRRCGVVEPRVMAAARSA